MKVSAASSRELLEDLPDYCTVVFIYDTVPYKPDRKMKKLTAAIDKNVEVVEFQGQSRDALVRWLQKRFRALDRSIDQQTADYMLFYCGSMMDNLIGEVNKVAAFAKAEQVTAPILRRGGAGAGCPDLRHDQPHSARDYNKAAAVLGDPAPDADGAPSSSWEPSARNAAALIPPHGFRQWQGPFLAHGPVADAQRLSRKAPPPGGPTGGSCVVQTLPSRLPAVGSAA